MIYRGISNLRLYKLDMRVVASLAPPSEKILISSIVVEMLVLCLVCSGHEKSKKLEEKETQIS